MSSCTEKRLEERPGDDAKVDVLHDDGVKKNANTVQGDYSGAVAKSDPAEIALVRKLDTRIMVCSSACSTGGINLGLIGKQPILWAMYFLNYLDRNALPQARLNGLEKDLNLKGVEYNTSISILFVGYLLMQGKCLRKLIYKDHSAD